ncbi:MAG: hypothetical protein ABGX83_01300 [Nitrospira sp.]|nr:hypothetical protein [Candidatus Manganitrophaceae bacterium]HIL35562.1 hypothetical protein [Candidatus Manganitrophaceae bacterium]
MEERRDERRKLTRGYGPERRVSVLLSPRSDLRRAEQRRKDCRTDDRRKKRTLPSIVMKPGLAVSDE